MKSGPADEIDEKDDDLDDAVIAADDTGMLAGERLITVAEIEEAEGNTKSAGDV